MSNAFAGHTILYTLKTEDRKGLLAALEEIDPETFEVILHPTEDLNRCKIRTESVEGAIAAINDIAPKWSLAVIRVYSPEEVAA